MTQNDKDRNDQEDDKNFLSRWSQRKQEAKQSDSVAPSVIQTEPTGATAESDVEEEFDLSTLPKLEEVVEGTDITGFLKKGVPESLRNAALRKSWALDPAIRNYVNPALDYAYDWNTPGGVPGSGELSAGMDVAKMVLQIMGGGESAGTAANSDTPDISHQIDSRLSGLTVQDSDAGQSSSGDLPTDVVRSSDMTTSPAEISAGSLQSVRTEAESGSEIETQQVGATQQSVRRHGTAKPTL